MNRTKTKNLLVRQARRYRISDELWNEIEPLLPKHTNTHRFGGGRPRVPDRQAMDGIFFVLRTGCQWNALNATGICSSSTAHLRFQEWTATGVFQKLWATKIAVGKDAAPPRIGRTGWYYCWESGVISAN